MAAVNRLDRVAEVCGFWPDCGLGASDGKQPAKTSPASNDPTAACQIRLVVSPPTHPLSTDSRRVRTPNGGSCSVRSVRIPPGTLSVTIRASWANELHPDLTESG